ncbi:dual specificity protein phosphatase 14 [Folsomia candida]|uniref:dual specificity protein phosphatase 14 n=1 Tax=Folsomia candida TaxID=158441 RepID=UPI000B8F4144|nr:dual specificity protein phosphatase 14 [Folsomia candida]XP_035710862.1 dual specificity protein phosphatase 14 [Folsomia candida]
MAEVDRRWLFNNPSTINGVGVGVPMSPNPKMHLEPIKVQPKNVTRGNNGNAIICKSNAPALSINGLGCDILSQINEITDGLYLCGARAMRAQHLLELGITNVVNVTVELPCLNIDEIESMKIQLDDSPYANLSYYFDRVADKVDEVRRKGGRIVIHCVAGVSRSATLIIAYLIKYKKMTLRQAYNFVKARRCCIRPNVGFFRQLVDYESRLMGCTSVKMVWNAAAGGYIPDVYEPEYNNTLLFLKKYGLQSDRLGRCAGERYRR